MPKDDREAVKWYRLAAEQRHPLAQFNLGFMYTEGKGVAKDDSEADMWVQRAAKRGFADAQFNLGVMYAEGKGVPKDDREAIKWFGRAAQQGLAVASLNLGRMYFHGDGVAEDKNEAELRFRRAAEQGNITAQEIIKLVNASGESVPVQADDWWNLATAQEAEAAINNISEFAKRITPMQFEKAQELNEVLVERSR